MWTVNPPGEDFVYSDISFMTMGFLCESKYSLLPSQESSLTFAVTSGKPLDQLLRERVLDVSISPSPFSG